jgi:hypothetical protein
VPTGLDESAQGFARAWHGCCIGCPHEKKKIFSTYLQRGGSRMGKYVIAWLLGVPAVLLVVVYVLFH